MWEVCSSIFDTQLSGGFENVAKWWLSRKKHAVLNMCTSAVLWCIWNMRNVFCFQGEVWSDAKKLLRKVVAMLKRWHCLCTEGNALQLKEVVRQMEARIKEPLRIMWDSPGSSTALPTTSWEPPLGPHSSSSGVLPMHDSHSPNSHLPVITAGLGWCLLPCSRRARLEYAWTYSWTRLRFCWNETGGLPFTLKKEAKNEQSRSSLKGMLEYRPFFSTVSLSGWKKRILFFL